MRVLFWSELFWPYVGGPELLAAKLLLALAARGYGVTVVTSHYYLDLPDEADYCGIPIHRFPFRTALTGAGMKEWPNIRQNLARLKRICAPQLVHINGLGASTIFNGPSGQTPEPPSLITLHTLHGQLENGRAGRTDTLFERALASADWIACVSQAVLRDARRLVPEILSRSSVVYNGLAGPNIVVEPLPFTPPRLLCLGRLIPAKGFDVALKAFSKLIRRFPHARMVIAGDGPMEQTLRQQAFDLGVEERIEFTGWIAPNKVPDLINSATMLLMPSRREGLPLVAIEAAQMARPVIATRVGGLPEIVLHDQTGLVIQPEDSNGLAGAIGNLLDNPEAAVSMGQAARQRVERDFAWNEHVDAYDSLYRRLIGESGRSAVS